MGGPDINFWRGLSQFYIHSKGNLKNFGGAKEPNGSAPAHTHTHTHTHTVGRGRERERGCALCGEATNATTCWFPLSHTNQRERERERERERYFWWVKSVLVGPTYLVFYENVTIFIFKKIKISKSCIQFFAFKFYFVGYWKWKLNINIKPNKHFSGGLHENWKWI